MPEVAEVAHVCALLKRNILGHTITRACLRPDELLFPGLKGAENGGAVLAQYEARLVGARVEEVRRHGKYFWVWVAHAARGRTAVLMHLGMTGRVRLRGVRSHLVFMEDVGARRARERGAEKSAEKEENETQHESPPPAEAWPPRFSKFELVLEQNGTTVDFAFADPRRLGRVQVLWGDNLASDEQLMAHPPLSRLGPDYSKAARSRYFARADGAFVSGDPDPDPHGRARPGYAEFARAVLARKRPIKAVLLDQALFAGVGNWVADEILYQAQLHPADVLSAHIHDENDARLVALYRSVVYVTEYSVSVEGNVDLFPSSWLMPHRWGKREKARARTELGEVEFETVGGRTSCYVPAVQKLMGGSGAEKREGEERAEKREGEERAVRKSEERAVRKSEERAVKKSEERAVEKSEERAKRGGGERAVKKSATKRARRSARIEEKTETDTHTHTETLKSENPVFAPRPRRSSRTS